MSTHKTAMPIEIANWRKNAKESVCVALDKVHNTTVLSVRVFYEHSPSDWRPSRKGICLSVKHLPALREAVTTAEHQARSTGLLS